MNNKTPKTKIVNDPVLGLIDFSSPLILSLIEHPWVQRLRRIKQLGMSDMVYPGAQHTRFLHTIGATSPTLAIARFRTRLSTILPM